ncbi:hypothetical protein JHK82_047389 [Glycine max]|nr:hypothetical protein JHK82_047389 [Glycine max]
MSMDSMATSIGVSVPVLRFLLCFAATVPLSFLCRFLPRGLPKHLYSSVVGVALSYLSFGFSSNLHFLVPMFLGYASMLLYRPRCGILTFFLGFGYLIGCHVYYMSGDAWKEGGIDATGALMVLTLKVISCAVNYNDGLLKEEGLREAQKKYRLIKLPSLIEYIGYCLCCGNVYERLIQTGKKPGFFQLLATQTVSAVWHGLYPGYIIFFVQSALMIAGSRVIYRWQQAVPPTMSLVKNVLVFTNFAYTLLVLNYSCVGFMVLSLHETLASYGSVYYIGTIVPVVMILLGKDNAAEGFLVPTGFLALVFNIVVTAPLVLKMLSLFLTITARGSSFQILTIDKYADTLMYGLECPENVFCLKTEIYDKKRLLILGKSRFFLLSSFSLPPREEPLQIHPFCPEKTLDHTALFHFTHKAWTAVKESTIHNMFSRGRGSDIGGHGNTNVAEWELRPGGMVVQKRNSDLNQNSASKFTIKVKVKLLMDYWNVVPWGAGELKKMLTEPTGLHVQDQKLIYKKKERDSKSYLDVERVKDGSKLVLVVDIESRERRILETLKIAKEKTSKSLTEIKVEVDKLAKKVAALEAAASTGGVIAELDIETLTENLMRTLIALDEINGEGELKLQRREQVRRVQKHIETLDMLRMARENSISLKNEEKNLARESKVHCGDHMQGRQGNPKKQQPLKHSESVVVTTKWETFD